MLCSRFLTPLDSHPLQALGVESIEIQPEESQEYIRYEIVGPILIVLTTRSYALTSDATGMANAK